MSEKLDKMKNDIKNHPSGNAGSRRSQQSKDNKLDTLQKAASTNQDIIDQINAANAYYSTLNHCNLYNGRSQYMSSTKDLIPLTETEALAAIDMNIHIGYPNAFPHYHGSHQDEYSFTTLESKEQVSSYLKKRHWANNNMSISIDPVYSIPTPIDLNLNITPQYLKNKLSPEEYSKESGNRKPLSPAERISKKQRTINTNAKSKGIER